MPLSRVAGRLAGRWWRGGWRRHGAAVVRAAGPATEGWATAGAYLWFVAYCWIGLLLSVAATRLTGTTSAVTTIVAVAGGGVLGWWQARHRLARYADPSTPPLARFGLALCAWLGLIGVALLVQAT